MMDLLIQKAYAAEENTAFNSLLQKIIDNVVSPIIYLLAALAVVYFVWGLLVFIKNADNVQTRQEGYQHMIWGIIGLFIMLSAKGLINIILKTMGL